MTKDKEEVDFKANKNDLAATVARSVLGAVPVVGAALTEVVNSIIPNQRIDRVNLYLEKLQSLFSEKEWQAIKKLPEKVAMIEEGIYAAGLTPYKERVDRIAYVIANGLSQEQIRADKISKLLFAAKNISDFDVIILESYRLWDNNAEGYELALAFRKEHPEIWPSIDHSFFDDDYDKEAYKKAKRFMIKLKRMSLLQKDILPPLHC